MAKAVLRDELMRPNEPDQPDLILPDFETYGPDPVSGSNRGQTGLLSTFLAWTQIWSHFKVNPTQFNLHFNPVTPQNGVQIWVLPKNSVWVWPHFFECVTWHPNFKWALAVMFLTVIGHFVAQNWQYTESDHHKWAKNQASNFNFFFQTKKVQ